MECASPAQQVPAPRRQSARSASATTQHASRGGRRPAHSPPWSVAARMTGGRQHGTAAPMQRGQRRVHHESSQPRHERSTRRGVHRDQHGRLLPRWTQERHTGGGKLAARSRRARWHGGRACALCTAPTPWRACWSARGALLSRSCSCSWGAAWASSFSSSSSRSSSQVRIETLVLSLSTPVTTLSPG